jgi:DNA-directed RNA polymerase alpha subunit
MAGITPNMARAIERSQRAHYWRGKLHARDAAALREEKYILKEYLAADNDLERTIERAIDQAAGKVINIKKLKAVKVSGCEDLPVGVRNLLVGLGYKTLADLEKVSRKKLLRHNNIGNATANVIWAALEKYGEEV